MAFTQSLIVLLHVVAILPPLYQGSSFGLSLGIGSLVFTVRSVMAYEARRAVLQGRVEKLQEDIAKLPPEERRELTAMLDRITKRKGRRARKGT